ncbi:MAG: (2Fe-2S)-binding protein, partial [Methylococcaceae bacterium]|nr:(2Fe-2S)-binding protein [Methylococcaceae bacterium]
LRPLFWIILVGGTSNILPFLRLHFLLFQLVMGVVLYFLNSETLVIKDSLDKDERSALLTGLPPLGAPDVGQIVCSCFNVGAKTILTAIKEKGLTTHQQVGQCLKAGTNCGSCVPEIKALL